MFGRCRWCRYGSRMEVPALLNQDLGHQSGFNIQGAFKTSYHSVLDDLKTCIDVLDDMDGVLDDVWTSVHCSKQDLDDQAEFNNLDLYQTSCLRRLGRNNYNRRMPF